MSVQIPRYPAVRPLELSDRSLLQAQLQIIQPQISELTFANLFLFRHAHHYTLTSINDSLVIVGCDYHGLPYFLPPLSGRRGETAMQLLHQGIMLYGADELFLEKYVTGTGFSVRADPDNDDYLYLRSELAELHGTRFHNKKNRIQHFSLRHNYTVEQFSTQYRESALQLLDRWQQYHEDGWSPSLQAETAAAREGIELTDKLGLSGVVVLTDNRVSAFALGEQLNTSTAVCLFEKADPALEGAAQLVNREFCRLQFKECIYINREQDLGEGGLREAKKSYHPVRMIRKFRVLPRL